MEQIAQLVQESQAAPEKRLAQTMLAQELTRMVHGDHGLAIAQKATQVLFGAALSETNLSADELESIFANVPSGSLSRKPRGNPLLDVICQGRLCRQ